MECAPMQEGALEGAFLHRGTNTNLKPTLRYLSIVNLFRI